MASIAPQLALAPNNRTKAAAYVRSIFNREMGVTLHNAQVGSPRDDAMRELTKATANLYARRVLRELIQNAFDGAAAAGEARIVVRFDMREGANGTLYVANTGFGFTGENVDAISNPALSNKRPGNFIGHKGLGFRSVELLSDDTQIYSVSGMGVAGGQFDGFCFRFASADDELSWLSEAKAGDLTEAVVGRTHRLQLPIPIETDPLEVSRFAVEGFATVVRLPMRDELAAERAREEMRLLIDERAPLALFLDKLSSLTLETLDREGVSEVKTLTRSTRERHVSTRGRGLIMEKVAVDRRRFLVASMPVDEEAFRDSVDHAVSQRLPVEKWREWVGAPFVSAAFPLSADARTGSFYAFLPMDTEAPFNGCLDAPFFPDADRRDLDVSNPLNSFLLDSIADLCLAVAEEIADTDDASLEMACVAVDALAWSRDPERLIEACARAGVEVGALRLPTVRRPTAEARWARLDEIYDWDDAGCQAISATWLVKACGVPMLRRGLGDDRRSAIHSMVDETDFAFTPPAERWAEWIPCLVADLNARRRSPRDRWEQLYADLANMPSVLPLLRGKRVFRVAEGRLADANGGVAVDGQELFISPDADLGGRRRRLSGTTLFPPPSVSKRMEFADPNLSWSPAVSKAMFDAGLATEYSLPRVVSRIGKLLGPRPSKTVRLAALRWAFTAWLTHKSPELEKALTVSGLHVPVVVGGFKPANATRFGSGWRETRGELIAELCDAAAETSKGARAMRDALLPSWDAWPLKDRGTAGEWVTFLKLLGVRDGLAAVYYKEQTQTIWTWKSMKSGYADPLAIEQWVGPLWRLAVSKAGYSGYAAFGYQSGSYSTGNTLFAFPLQSEHDGMSPRARLAFARLLLAAMADVKDAHLTTVLQRTAGNSDEVRWPSPLLAFLREAEWVPVPDGEGLRWARPSECWYSPRTDPMPRIVPRMDRSVREVLDGSAAVRELFTKHLSLRIWGDPASAIARLELLGELLEAGVAESEHDGLRSGLREAWRGWHASSPRPALPSAMPLVVQAPGRLAALRVAKGGEHPTVFIGEGDDAALENLLISLGHFLLPVPSETGNAVAEALQASIGGKFVVASTARPTILVDGQPLDARAEAERLAGPGREWLAEIAVLALEFNRGFSNRATARTRQQLVEAFRRLRIVVGRRIQVEIEGRVGDLPAELDGVLPVPHPEHPVIVVQSAMSGIDWLMLSRVSRGVAAAVERPWLDTDMRLAFLELAASQPGGGPPQRPADELMARAFGQPVERVREIVRSLLSDGRRLFEQLVPVVWARAGEQVARNLLAQEHRISEDTEIITALVADGVAPAFATELVMRARDADGLDDLRRQLKISLAEMNTALSALGPPWKTLSFEPLLRDTFYGRLDERRAELELRLRDAYLAEFDAGRPLTSYVEERKLEWITFDPAWVDERDELDNATIDARVDDIVAARCVPALGSDALMPVELTRQHNRALLVERAEELRKLVFAWVAKDSANRTINPEWRSRVEQIARVAMAAGSLDFRCLDENSLILALVIANLWPPTMPRTTALSELGLAPEDLEVQARAEKEAQEAELKRRRTVTVGSVDIDGGAEGAFHQMAAALEAALSDRAFQLRSGPADLREFPHGDVAPPKSRKGRGGGRDPEYMTDERRTLVGFAGELAAYHYLRHRIRGFSDEHWLSSIGRRYLALPAASDDDGFDFRVPRARGALMFEVKAHEGDPGYVELERSQVAAAVAHAHGRKGVWSILYVPYATDPARIAVFELPNPFSEGGLNRFRASTRQGVRLLLDRNGLI